MFSIESNLEDLRSSEIIISVLATAPQIHNQIVESQPKLPSIMGQNTECKILDYHKTLQTWMSYAVPILFANSNIHTER